MSVRIVVEKGPDRGKSLVLDARAEMRLGRGPGNHLMVQDPAWQGALRVSFKQGVCKVTNQTPATIYLGGKTFPPGEQRAWFHGESLQPTAQTLLVLYVGDDGKAVTNEATPATARRKRIQLTVILLCLPLAALLLMLPKPQESEESKSPEQIQQQYQKLETRLAQLQDGTAGGEMAGRVLLLLKDARFEQLREHHAQAFKIYQRLSQELEADLGTPIHERPVPEEVAEVLRGVRDFVNQQLIALAQRIKSL